MRRMLGTRSRPACSRHCAPCGRNDLSINYFLGGYFGVCCNGAESRAAATVSASDPGRKSLLLLPINFTLVPPNAPIVTQPIAGEKPTWTKPLPAACGVCDLRLGQLLGLQVSSSIAARWCKDSPNGHVKWAKK